MGGRFWPQVRVAATSSTALRAGVVFAIHKAMGDTELANLGLPTDYRDRLWKAERDNGIDIDDGIRGIALSWNCVAPAGEDYFEVEALRGPDGGRVRHRHAAPVRARHGDGAWPTTCAPGSSRSARRPGNRDICHSANDHLA